MTDTPEHYAPRCVLCAARDVHRPLDSGHCCPSCRVRIDDDLAAIVRLAAEASAQLVPASTGNVGRSVPASKPPINLDAVEPADALVLLDPDDPSSATTVLEVLESLERLIRDERGFARYGPASVARGGATLTGCVEFLRGQVEYVTTEPTFGLEQFAREVRLCVRALRRWDVDAEDRGTSVPCPTVTEAGECGWRLTYRQLDDEPVTCRRCGATRDIVQLAYVAMSDGRPVWMDPENAARWLGVSEATLRRMARGGHIERRHGQYMVREQVLAG